MCCRIGISDRTDICLGSYFRTEFRYKFISSSAKSPMLELSCRDGSTEIGATGTSGRAATLFYFLFFIPSRFHCLL